MALVVYAGNKSDDEEDSLNPSASLSSRSGLASALPSYPYSAAATVYDATARNSASSVPFVGLSNQGATCYLNGLLQVALTLTLTVTLTS